ncbi:hypothetical protein IF1G_11083 [Cordyceps javanica]|uniref:Uncharacterized protein n=1 Tax=Cordyceps javanica TaxID=43265 RepID=A0A545ULB4_9HYPO|nr:hypothetical protein IF1G_11083 [Cordyceps javanica]TQW01553.1 hypothetical protein IF2G_10911 [Cordyceps javanica]
MADEIDTQDATFFAALNGLEQLNVEMRKTEARLKALKIMHAVAAALQQTLHEQPIRPMVERACRLGQTFNSNANSAFAKEIECLSFDQLCFLAKGYDASRIGRRLRADCLQIFMLTHNASVDNAARKFVSTGAKRAGGRFFEIFEEKRVQTTRIAAAEDITAICRTACLTKDTSNALRLSTIPMIEKTRLPGIFHADLLAMMEKDKSWGDETEENCSNIKHHIYKKAFEVRIDVPRGIDPRTIKIFKPQTECPVVQFDTIDVVVVKFEKNITIQTTK